MKKREKVHNVNTVYKIVEITRNTTTFQYWFDSTQVKRALISSITNFVSKLLHELPNNLRLRILKLFRKISKINEDGA